MDNLTTSMYKYDDIKDHFEDWLDNNDMTVKQAFQEYNYDLHYQVFNTDYFIIGYYQAEQWLVDEGGHNRTFEVLGYVMEREKAEYGLETVFDNAETLVNNYAYWLGQEIVYEAIYKLEEE